MKHEYPCRLRNASGRPVELHRDGEVAVLLPGGLVEMAAHDAGCEALLDAGVLTHHAPLPKKKPKPRKSRPAAKKAKPAAAKAVKPKAAKATRPAGAKAPKATAAHKPAAATKSTKTKPARAGTTPTRGPSRAGSRTAKDDTGGSR